MGNFSATSREAASKVEEFITEVNDVFGDDKDIKHAFALRLAKHPWFEENGQEVRYQPGKNLISISSVSRAQQIVKGKSKGWGDDGGFGSWPGGGSNEVSWGYQG